MSNQELYEIARQRVDRRNHRWTLWAFDLAGLVLAVAAMILLVGTPFRLIGVAVMIAWGGVFTLHTIVASMGHSRDEDIEKEVARLREATYEKPKRLTDDGELVDEDEWMYEEEAKRTLKA